jgi:hypothetical protein
VKTQLQLVVVVVVEVIIIIIIIIMHGVHSAVTHLTWRAGFCWGELKERNNLEDLGRRQEDNIAMSLREVGWGDMDWIALAQDLDTWRTLDECSNVLSGSIKCVEFDRLRTY